MFLRGLILFIPFFISLAFTSVPEVSYLIAWSGSFFIILVSFLGFIRPFSESGKILDKPMRPLVLTHLIFSGYMAISSIFYFLRVTGHYYLVKDEFAVVDVGELLLVAECQRYYCLGHAAFVVGLFINMNYKFEPRYKIEVVNISGFTLSLTYFFSILVFFVQLMPGLSQFSMLFSGLSVVASVISLAYAIPEGKPIQIAIAGFLFITNEINALTSGWKEAVIVPIIMLGTYLYPSYKKSVTFAIPVVLGVYFYFIPTYNNIIRNLSWSGELDGKSAALVAVESLRNGDEDVADNNWEFLTGRLSEISMFTIYVKEVPKNMDYFGSKIIEQALVNIIPRFLFPEKPVTEILVMERVVAVGVISELSIVSAKPPPIADGYMSGGIVGVFFTCFLIGAFASWASSKAEYLFGNYLFGSGLIYTGLFQILWRGNCFEFMANSLFWGTIVMYLIFYIGKVSNIIKEIRY